MPTRLQGGDGGSLIHPSQGPQKTTTEPLAEPISLDRADARGTDVRDPIGSLPPPPPPEDAATLPAFALPRAARHDEALERAIDWVYASLNERGSLTHGESDAVRRAPAWTRALLDALGAPDRRIPALYVTGSKGKGSTSVFAAAALQAGAPGQGPVGLVTSPHLLDFAERIRVDLRAMSGDELRRLIEAVEPLADAIRARIPRPFYASPVGAVTALAAVHFRSLNARYAVYEAGRGGRFDDTAELEHTVTVITTLFPEHLRELGPTLKDIAWHKAGAIREGTHTVVQGAFPPDLDAEIEQEARRVGARRLILGRAITVRVENGPENGRPRAHAGFPEDPGGSAQMIHVTTPSGSYGPLPVPLAGRHQRDNLALAVAAAESLAGRRLKEAPLRRLLQTLRWPGRMETVRDPAGGPALLDASIEPGAARAAAAHARMTLPGPYVALVGIGTGKDYEAVWNALAEASLDVIVTEAQNPYLRFPDRGTTDRWIRHDPMHRLAEPDFAKAWRVARERVGVTGTILVLGTVSLIADALRLCQLNASDLG